jgi:polyisoprenyl-phosphate glycosyltransferase
MAETRYSIVVPVYKNEGTIISLIKALEDLSAKLNSALEVVFVVDGSPDQSYALLKANLPHASFASEMICLSRNFGSFAAIREGLSVAQGPYFAVMAADLQEPPQLMIEFFTVLRDEPIDVVIGTRADRDDPFFAKLSANLFWGVYCKLVQRDMPEGGVDIFGCNAAVRDALLQLKESNSSLVGLLLWLGFRRKSIQYMRQARKVGKSAWTLRRKLRYMLDNIFSFTDLPILVLIGVGTAGLIIAFVVSIVVLTTWILGMIVVAGYTPLMLSIMLSTSMILLALGMIGSYVWRTFENTKQRPLFVPMTRESFCKDKKP